MINKKSLWFLTLFSLILVLSIYYITMPSELLLTTSKEDESDTTTPTVTVEESDVLVSLRVESDEEMNKEIEELEEVVSKNDSTTEEKNEAYEKIKKLNNNRSEEEKLEAQIKDTYDLDSFIKIKDSSISVTIVSEEHSEESANNIMRTIQANYDTYKHITVKYQK